jgi:hypothetical protein
MEGLSLARADEVELLLFMGERFRDSIAALHHYVESGAPLEDYARYSIFLSRLDSVFRAGSVVVVDEYLISKFGRSYFSQKSSVSDQALVENALELASLFERSFEIIAMSHASLNPVFLPYSGLVGGADADIIFDSTLLDLKSTMKLGYSSEDWAQVLGYAAMARASGLPIEHVGIYFARYGLNMIIPLTGEVADLLPSYLGAILSAAEN